MKNIQYFEKATKYEMNTSVYPICKELEKHYYERHLTKKEYNVLVQKIKELERRLKDTINYHDETWGCIAR